MKRLTFILVCAITVGCTSGCESTFAVASAVKTAPPASDVGASKLILPLEVDIAVAEQFVRIGYALDRTQRFQSTEFLTPRLRTTQASHLIRLVTSYNEFDGEAVAQAVAALRGRVSGVEFGREGSPVVYVELPYWTHQREEAPSSGMGTKISDEENDKLVAELRDIFVGKLKADEFSVQRRRVRIWWD
jgi:hypothetical protein